MTISYQIDNELRQLQPFPLLGDTYSQGDFAKISLNSCEEINLLTNKALHRCISSQLKEANAQIGYGGYLEDRIIYRRSSHFDKGGETRSIHLGMDIWAAAGTPIYAPLSGSIHSWAYNDAPADYGATLVVQHQVGDLMLHSLYGHISRGDLNQYKPGGSIQQGEIICHIGDENENGGWVPHLHFQLIINMQGKKGDYPGVAAPSDLEFYRNNCPDPGLLFRRTNT